MNNEGKLIIALNAVISGEFYSADYNDQECGGVSYKRLLADSKKGDTFEVYASPNSCRECADGAYLVEVLDRIAGQENWFTDFSLKIRDNMGNIGSYPNYEWYQIYNCSGTYIVRLLADGQFQINPTDGFDLERVRRRCRDALNKNNNPTTILNVAGELAVKIW